MQKFKLSLQSSLKSIFNRHQIRKKEIKNVFLRSSNKCFIKSQNRQCIDESAEEMWFELNNQREIEKGPSIHTQILETIQRARVLLLLLLSVVQRAQSK
jgi:hypothetical protein